MIRELVTSSYFENEERPFLFVRNPFLLSSGIKRVFRETSSRLSSSWTTRRPLSCSRSWRRLSLQVRNPPIPTTPGIPFFGGFLVLLPDPGYPGCSWSRCDKINRFPNPELNSKVLTFYFHFWHWCDETRGIESESFFEFKLKNNTSA